MSRDAFNQEAPVTYPNHAKVLRVFFDVGLLPILQLASDESAPAAQQRRVWQVVRDLRDLSAAVKRSDAIALQARMDLVGYIDITEKAMQQTAALLAIKAGEAQGHAADPQVVQHLMIDVASLQAAGAEQQLRLYETLYSFKPGQTLDDITATGDITIEDFERAHAMITYSGNMNELLQRAMAQIQYGDSSAAEELAEALAAATAQLTTLQATVGASSRMDDQQKNTCLATLRAIRSYNTAVGGCIEAAVAGDILGVMNHMKDVGLNMTQVAKTSRGYLQQLDQHYRAKAAGSAATTQKPPAPPKP